MRFSRRRDALSAAIGFATGPGIVGMLAKKLLVADDDAPAKRALVGALAACATGGLALVPYLLATPGREAGARVRVVEARDPFAAALAGAHRTSDDHR